MEPVVFHGGFAGSLSDVQPVPSSVAQSRKKLYVKVPEGSGVVQDQIPVFLSSFMSATGQVAAAVLGWVMGKSHGLHWSGRRPADVVVVVSPGPEKAHSPLTW